MSKASSIDTTGVCGVGGNDLYFPTDATPEQIFQEIGKLRKEARDEIDRLIGFLDVTDNHMCIDPDLEDGADSEPSLCGVTVETTFNDRDLEPDLGSFDRMIDQTKSNMVTSADSVRDGEIDDDREDDDPAEDDGSCEPSLGSVGEQHINQTGWGSGSRSDLEHDDGESGIGDQDGLDEQVPFRDWQNRGMV